MLLPHIVHQNTPRHMLSSGGGILRSMLFAAQSYCVSFAFTHIDVSTLVCRKKRNLWSKRATGISRFYSSFCYPWKKNWRCDRTLTMQFYSRILLHISRIYPYQCIAFDLGGKAKATEHARDWHVSVLVVVFPMEAFRSPLKKNWSIR